MKVLVTYFSQTGNTEQIAKAIHEEASQSNDAVLSKLEETDAGSLNDYDVIFFGAPIHSGGLAAPAKELLEGLPEASGLKLAGFVTHSAFAYEKQSFEKGLLFFEEISKAKGISFLGSFSCQGRLAPALHSRVQKMRGLSDEEWAERTAKSDKHPDAEDEANARAFAKEMLSKP